MNTGAKPTLSERYSCLMSLSFQTLVLLSLCLTSLPKKNLLPKFHISAISSFLQTSSELVIMTRHKLHVLSLNQPVWQLANCRSELPEFLTSCVASVLPLHGSTIRREAPVHCCHCEAGCWAAWRILQLPSHCSQHRACSVPITAMSRSHHAAYIHRRAHTNTHNSLKIPRSILLQKHHCHSLLTVHRLAPRVSYRYLLSKLCLLS